MRIAENVIFRCRTISRCDDLNGCLDRRFDEGIGDINCRGVEIAAEFSTPQPHRRGLGGRGWQECVEPDEGYAPSCNVGRFEVVIICVSPRVFFFAAGRSTRRDDPNRRLDVQFDDGMVNIKCRGVEFAGEF